MKRIFFVLILSVALTGCIASVDPSITTQTRVIVDAKVNKSKVVVSSRPKGRQLKPLTALFLPFYVQQQDPEHALLGKTFGEIFYNEWLGEEHFPVFEYAHRHQYLNRDQAIQLGRHYGADLTVVGIVPYFLNGSTVGDSAITVQIHIFYNKTGARLLSMAQSARIDKEFAKDWISFKQETRMPDSPLYVMIREIAKDMGRTLGTWLPSPGTPYPFTDDTNAMVASLSKTPKKRAPADPTAKVMERSLATLPPVASGFNLQVHFDTGKATIRPTSKALLDNLGKALTSLKLAGKRFRIAGHTDSNGDDMANLKLSKDRAEAVRQYLIQNFKMKPDQLEATGFGESKPIADNNTAVGKAKNRRVEVTVIQ